MILIYQIDNSNGALKTCVDENGIEGGWVEPMGAPTLPARGPIDVNGDTSRDIRSPLIEKTE